MIAALRGDRDALDLVRRAIGKVDVDEHVARNPGREHAADDVGAECWIAVSQCGGWLLRDL